MTNGSEDGQTDVKVRVQGVQGHFCMFSSNESPFHRSTAPFNGTKIPQCVKKLLTFEGQPSDNFPYRNI